MKKLLLSLMICGLCSVYLMAQDAPPLPTVDPNVAVSGKCPVQTQGAFNATKLICENLDDGEACIGNGIVEATARQGVTDLKFSQPSDRTAFVNFSEVRLRTLDTDNALWAVVNAKNVLATSVGASAPTTMLIFGDTTITDNGDVSQQVDNGQPVGTVIADFGLIIRRKPDPSGGIAWQLVSGEQVTVTGQTADKTWFRVDIPSGFGGVGWVYAPYLDVSGIENVPFVDVSSPAPTRQPQSPVEFSTMQAFKLSSALTDPSCTDSPDSGVLLQSPNGVPDNVRVRVNGVVIEFSGTIFIQAQANASLRVTVLEGEAILTAGDNRTTVPVNQAGIVTMGASLEALSAPSTEAIDPNRFALLPIALLQRPIALSVVVAPTEAPTTAEQTTTVPVVATPVPETATTVATTSDALPTPVMVGSLESSELGEICGKEPTGITQTATPVGTSTQLGGIWTATSGTTVTFEILGGTFQPSFNTFIRLNAVTGIVAQSGDDNFLTFTFTADTSFSASFSSKAGDNLLLTVRCGS